MKTLIGATALVVAGVAVILAQAPDFSGTWKLDQDRSRIVPTAGLAALSPSGAPATLHITQPANGTLVIESQINESHARLYVTGGRSSTPVGQTGTITMTTRWDGRSLVSEGRQETMAGTTTVVKDVREVMAFAPDGRTLTIEITEKSPEQTSVSTLTYTRSQDVGPCHSWPTPCKPPPP